MYRVTREAEVCVRTSSWSLLSNGRLLHWVQPTPTLINSSCMLGNGQDYPVCLLTCGLLHPRTQGYRLSFVSLSSFSTGNMMALRFQVSASDKISCPTALKVFGYFLSQVYLLWGMPKGSFGGGTRAIGILYIYDITGGPSLQEHYPSINESSGSL